MTAAMSRFGLERRAIRLADLSGQQYVAEHSPRAPRGEVGSQRSQSLTRRWRKHRRRRAQPALIVGGPVVMTVPSG